MVKTVNHIEINGIHIRESEAEIQIIGRTKGSNKIKRGVGGGAVVIGNKEEWTEVVITMNEGEEDSDSAATLSHMCKENIEVTIETTTFKDGERERYSEGSITEERNNSGTKVYRAKFRNNGAII